MRIIADENLTPGWSVMRMRPPQETATFFLKGTFTLQHGHVAAWAKEPDTASGDQHVDGDVAKELLYPSDFAPFKPRADVIVLGTAFAPGGASVDELNVGIQVGSLAKSLRVFGTRHWNSARGAGRSAAVEEPFLSMRLSYERALGGAKDPFNPVGVGRSGDLLPQIENPNRLVRNPRDEIEPAGFGPVAGGWKQRMRHVGTYDDAWRKTRWPSFPQDFEWSYFNAAPQDQQIDDYLRGDELVEIENLHASIPTFQTRLPGLRARCFLEERSPESADTQNFREVRLHLDTLWIDMDAEKMVLVWRGLADVRSRRLREIERLFVFTESLAAPQRSLEEYRTQMHGRIAAIEHEGEEVAETPEEIEEPDTTEAEIAEFDRVLAQSEADAAKAEAAVRAELDPSRMALGSMQPKPPPMTLADLRVTTLAQIAEMRTHATLNPAELTELQEQLGALDEMEQMEKEMNELIPDEVELGRADVIRMARQGESFSGKELADLDLSGLDLSRLNFSKARLARCNLSGCRFIETNLAGADLGEAILQDADLSGAKLVGADFAEANLTGALFPRTDVARAVFTDQNLGGADFSQCHGRGADFSGTNLKSASFVDADLPQADFSHCNLEAADFRGAKLHAAQLEQVKARNINLEDAEIIDLHASDGSDFSDAVFANAKGNGSIWDGSTLDRADFRRAELNRAIFSEASAREANFDRAHLANAILDDADLTSAILTNANLLRASLERANLTDLDARGSNFYEAGFCDAIVTDAQWQDANLTGTQLR